MTLWRGDTPLILASQSRARHALLVNAGIEVEVIPAHIDERTIQRSAGPATATDIAALLAREKALAISAGKPGRYILGADQTLALGDRLFNKPYGREQAVEQLQALAGRAHQLRSAIAVVRDRAVLFEHVATAVMTMRPLEETDITIYLDQAGDAVTSSVGAYQVESLGVHLFERIDGDHFTILGLPLLPLFGFLRSRQLLAV
jgi:septum formation protein